MQIVLLGSLSSDDRGRGEVFLVEHHWNIRSIVVLMPWKQCSHTSGEGYYRNKCTLWFTFSHSISQQQLGNGITMIFRNIDSCNDFLIPQKAEDKIELVDKTSTKVLAKCI